MPRPKPWISSLPGIIAMVEVSQAEHFVRRDIEEIFGIKPSAAKELMGVAGGDACYTGKLRVSRVKLLEYLRYSKDCRAALEEVERKKQRAVEAEARKVRIPVTLGDEWSLFSELPNVSLEPGKLTIVFDGEIDLLQQLWKLSKAIQNQPAHFQKVCAERPAAYPDPRLEEREGVVP